jgi:endonuclease/exonuclease/phosphatase family metal-dependent hydrolase
MLETRRRRPLAALTVALTMTAGAAACDVEPDQSSLAGPDLTFLDGRGHSAARSLDVYTQNLFLGGDTGPLFGADLSNPVTLLQAVNGFWAEVQSSDAPARMARIVDIIERRNPDLVGVQEALQFVTLDITPTGPQPTGAIDLLATLVAEIQARGLPYEVAVQQVETSAALPLAIDFSTGQVTRALSFTDRVAILRRTDVEVTNTDGAAYAAALPIAGISIKRGWASVTVERDGVPHHFVTTHLETQAAQPIHDLQAAELLATVSAFEGVTIVSGDLNSDAEAGPGDPSWTPTYGTYIAAGFADLWDLAPHARRDSGFTCCQDPDLRNATSSLDERIDFFLIRSSDGPLSEHGLRRGVFRADVVADQSVTKTPSGLWPSDHAGIVGSIRLATRED